MRSRIPVAWASVALACLVHYAATAQDHAALPYDPDPDSPIGERNPRAPAEMVEFEFVIGDWDVEVTHYDADGPTGIVKAKWHNHWINFGFDIMQEWRGHGAVGSEFRHYNKQLGHWEGKNLYAGHIWTETSARREGENMVVIVKASNEKNGPFLNRETYFNITENRWQMKSERSFDDGKTWERGVYEMTATRATP